MNKHRFTRIKSQRGATLFMALMLLLAISLLTYNSMQGSGLHTRVAGNYVANERTVQGAESAVERVLQEGNKVDTKRFINAVIKGTQQDCITKQDFIAAKCQQSDTFDSYALLSPTNPDRGRAGDNLIVGSITEFKNTASALGFDTRNFGSLVFQTRGASFYSQKVAVNFATENQLDWRRWGPKGNFNSAKEK